MLIQEVILENFMSYEYARVPFKPGVNVICGPNGSGKSSLLLAISVALGQSYTERSKKLSNLIRWGKDQARVTVVLDNSKREGKRPIPRLNKDQIYLTRVLRRDGKYWFELDNKAATKQEVERLLGKFGVDPDNMLIIMHQNMVEQFTVLSNVEKLRMVEAAVGLEPFRENVLQAQRKLTQILSQEESVSKLLESAEQTLNYWRGQYERYQEKKQLLAKRRFLERELAWAEVERRESVVRRLESDIQEKQASLKMAEAEIASSKEQLETKKQEQGKVKQEFEDAVEERVQLERAAAQAETALQIYMQLIEETQRVNTTNLPDTSTLRHTLLDRQKLGENVKSLQQTLEHATARIAENRQKTRSLGEIIEKLAEETLKLNVHAALLQYRFDQTMAELKELEIVLSQAKAEVASAAAKAEQHGARIAVVRALSVILDEIRVTDGHLAALSDVTEDIERMYESYSKLYLELKEKAYLVAQNREKALEEVRTRMQAWRTVIQNLLDRVNLEYQKILEQALATGEVRLSNGHDIETAGLEILVGFKGGKPVALDAYTQSGGERTTATMSFLLALQQHVRSPLRAVDEYDIHMDPKNRETIAQMLVSTIKHADTQYIVITPSQVTFTQEDANIITVQNVQGKSIIKEVSR
jgi:chromosome segregation ATPase